MTAEQRAKTLNYDVHRGDVQKDLWVPAPPVEGGVLKEAEPISFLGRLFTQFEKLQAEVAELKTAQAGNS